MLELVRIFFSSFWTAWVIQNALSSGNQPILNVHGDGEGLDSN